MGYIDLHVHSNASDGTYSPAEVAGLASAAGLSAIALTDHDTTRGVAEAQQAGDRLGLRVIPGIEVSSAWQGREIHILGLFIAPGSPELEALLSQMRMRREQRNAEMLRRLGAAGITLSPEELCGGNPNTILTRAHVARALVQRGLASSIDQAFRKYLNYDRGFCPPKDPIPPEEVVRVLLRSGAFVSLAHPFQYHLGDQGTNELIRQLAELGMQGVEVYHSSHNPLEISKLQAWARALRLLPTGGSDFHGANKPDIQIGRGRGTLHISSLLLDDIEKRLAEAPNPN